MHREKIGSKAETTPNGAILWPNMKVLFSIETSNFSSMQVQKIMKILVAKSIAQNGECSHLMENPN